MQDFHALLHEWETFYLLVGTAGAALAGLMFVAISVGERLGARGRIPVLRALIDPALLAFVLSLVLGGLLLMPSLTRAWFGALLLTAGVLGLGYIAVVLRQLITGGNTRVFDLSDWLWYAGAPVVAGALLVVSGSLGLAGAARAALDLTGVSVVVLLLMGIRNAWDVVTFAIAQFPAGQPARDDGGPPA